MVKHTQPAAPSTHLSDLEEHIARITQQVKERFGTLKHEAQSLHREMERLSEQHQRLTGKALLATESNGTERGGRSAGTRTEGNRSRTRKPSPTVEWLQETLSKRGMTVRQLQDAADAGYSGIRIAAMLKEHKTKFRSEPGKKEEKQKGVPAAVWG